jgi:predicted GNAT family N-acyltransferase
MPDQAEVASFKAHRDGLEVAFSLATAPVDRGGIFDSRYETYHGTSEYLLNTVAGLHPAEDKFDAGSFLFRCSQGEKVLASCRFTPPIDNLWEVTELCSLPTMPPVDTEDLLQVSRVVVAREARGLHLGEVMMYFCCLWLLRHSRFAYYFAVCSPPLARFYRHFGVKVLWREEMHLPGRGTNRYILIHGDLGDSLARLHEFLTGGQWSLFPSVSSPNFKGEV